ncbi:MAG: hypothetical protein ACETVW_05510 [Dehalococcoidia bacterium]
MEGFRLRVTANITDIIYKPLLCRELQLFEYDQLEKAVSQNASFLLRTRAAGNISVSWWVSPKRTRSYPYARVYDTLGFSGKKVTIIPVIKDEGKDGDRDFLQWDTVSLMSLLGVHVILGYYVEATRNINYRNKVTNQCFSFPEIKTKMEDLLSYQSDALHWNISQIEQAGEIARKALQAYGRISEALNIEMHSDATASKRIQELLKGRDEFMNLSRRLAEKAQRRESITTQPKEKLTGTKAILTIRNYLGGYYFFTADEAWVEGHDLFLAEGKYTKGDSLPSIGDIKDGLLKMILFTNLEDVQVNGLIYNCVAVLKLTTVPRLSGYRLNENEKRLMDILSQEAQINRFRIAINDRFVI